MNGSHSTKLVKQAAEACRLYLEAEAGRHAHTAPTLLESHNIMNLGHTLNRVLRRANLHVDRATTFDEASARGYDAGHKSEGLSTMLQVQADPTGFDAVYDALSDDDSRRTFDWFISYRTALAFLGRDADDVVPGAIGPADWQALVDRAGRTFAGGAYHVDGMTIDTLLGELVLTFFLEQYRLEGIVEPRSGDVVLDCGAYRGETALWFARRAGKSGRVVTFEPSAQNAEGLRRNLAANQSVEMAPITLLEAAVSSSAGMLHFNAHGENGSHVDAASTESVTAVTIDGVVGEQHLGRVDFIKMDIEGAEVDALKGAEETLQEFAPRLAISVYHRPHDLPDVGMLIRQARPDYRLYLSQKPPGLCDTILFAVRGDLS
jgi:FkbM family methyltransferase